MSKVIDFFRLIRFTNIIFIAFSQLLFQYCIIAPTFQDLGLVTTLSIPNFFLLTFSTTLLAAAGYIINDYFDEKIDVINKPAKVFIEKSIRRRVAMALHFTFTGLATLIGFYLAFITHNYKMALINPAVAVLLWFYSTTFKRQYIIGNVVVSLLCVLTIIVPVLYEKQLFSDNDDDTFRTAAFLIFLLMFCYSIFAFLATMIREVVKDMEDVQGDARCGCKTMPVVLGLRPTKKYTGVLAIVALGLMLMLPVVFQINVYSLFYVILLIITPMIYFIYRLYYADVQKDFHRLSTIIKFIIFTGILSMILFSFTSLTA